MPRAGSHSPPRDTAPRETQPRAEITAALAGAHPAARRYGGSAFDVSRREWIVFGGTKETSDFGDLWRFDAARNTWEELTAMGPGGGDLPHARGFPLFGYDVASEQYLLFGGYTQPAYTDVRAGWSLRLRP